MRGKPIVSLAAIAMVVALASSASANVMWGGTNANWNDPTKWVGGALPGTTDTAEIASGTAYMNAVLSPAPASIIVDSAGTVSFAYSGTITNNLVLNGGTILDQANLTNPVLSGNILLTGNSTIKNIRGNANQGVSLSGNITEDSTPRMVTFAGNAISGYNRGDNTGISGNNTWSGGTTISGSQVNAGSLTALGTGPVNISGGMLSLRTAGANTFGKVTVTSGVLQIGAKPENLTLDLQGGTLNNNNNGVTIDNTNSITISNTVNMGHYGTGYNNLMNIGTSIAGTGKAVLMNPAQSSIRMQFSAVQQWTGGTEVDGIVEMVNGGVLPAGTVTVLPLPVGAYGNGLLRLLNTTADQNGGLNPNTDLVLSSRYDPVKALYTYSTLCLGSNVAINSLMINGSYMAPGVYTAADLPNYLVGSGTKTLTVAVPEPATISLMVLGGLLGLIRRRMTA